MRNSAHRSWAASVPGFSFGSLTWRGPLAGWRALGLHLARRQPRPTEVATWSCPALGLWMLGGRQTAVAKSNPLLRLSRRAAGAGHGHIHLPRQGGLGVQNPRSPTAVGRVVPPTCSSRCRRPRSTTNGRPAWPPALARWVLAGFEQRPIHTLSGGQAASGHRRRPRQ